MQRKIKKRYVIYITLSLIILISAILKSNYYNIKNAKDQKQNDINVSLVRVKEILDKNITNREIILKDSTVLVGNTDKELENDFYDIKIYLEENILKIHINKLWKNFNVNLYEDEYLSEVAISVTKILELSDFEKIKSFLLQGYREAKDDIANSYNKNSTKDKEIKIYETIENKELILTVCKEVGNEE